MFFRAKRTAKCCSIYKYLNLLIDWYNTFRFPSVVFLKIYSLTLRFLCRSFRVIYYELARLQLDSLCILYVFINSDNGNSSVIFIEQIRISISKHFMVPCSFLWQILAYEIHWFFIFQGNFSTINDLVNVRKQTVITKDNNS